jgi:8-oxo-dGTP pyrophosphatase MutT (NUDIX family)
MTPLPENLTEAHVRRVLAVLSTRTLRRFGTGEGAASAVLAPLFEHQGDAHVWLLKRPETLRSHAGQIAFPGGKYEPQDPTLEHTALREAEEEVGLTRGDVQVLGPLDTIVTGTGFVISPYVGWVRADFVPTPNPGEVARIFHVPLRTFTARAYGTFPRIGVDVAGEFVWGATYAMLRNLCQIIAENAT